MNQHCFHCAEPVPADSDCRCEINGQLQTFCCAACLAVCQCIIGAGLDSYYRLRDDPASRPESEAVDFSQYDDDDVLSNFSQRYGDGWRSNLAVSELHCAACAWLIEHRLLQLPGVLSASVNLQRGLLSVHWEPTRIHLSAIFSAVHQLGYPISPWSRSQRDAQVHREMSGLLRRLGMAGIAMMQLGMVSIALYAGAFQDMDLHSQHLLRYFGLLLATPVLLYSAQPFFRGAWRNLRNRRPGMDTPVALALLAAYIASASATLSGHGEVYFDTVSMFCFFLLLSRYLQALVQRRQEQSLRPLLPMTARRVNDDGSRSWVPLAQLAPGEIITVAPGELLPADGTVVTGHSSIEDSAFSGEFFPRPCGPGRAVLAGSRNLESTLHIRVTRAAEHSRLLQIDQLLASAVSDKPKMAVLADRLGQVFVLLVLVAASATALGWHLLGGHNPFLTTLAVLVVSCPCALSLATPTSYTAAVNALRKRGLLVTRAAVLEQVGKLSHVVFDKTGTLTDGRPEVVSVDRLGDLDRRQLLSIACALEAASNHPLASAFRPEALAHFGEIVPATLSGLLAHGGLGIEGWLGTQHFRLGSLAFCRASADPTMPLTDTPTALAPQQQLSVFLSRDGQILGRIELVDHLRDDAEATVRALQQRGLKTILLSGDSSSQVARVASQLGFDDFRSGCSAADKLAFLHQLQSRGAVVMMVGDGVNDAPVMAAATISAAMSGASDVTRSQADINLLNQRLGSLLALFEVAAQMRAILRANLGWAFLYNMLALPAAALGLVPPWAAAVGMSLSSVLVVVNALRIGRHHQPASVTHKPKTATPLTEAVHG